MLFTLTRDLLLLQSMNDIRSSLWIRLAILHLLKLGSAHVSFSRDKANSTETQLPQSALISPYDLNQGIHPKVSFPIQHVLPLCFCPLGKR
jgi:hypothetical protein